MPWTEFMDMNSGGGQKLDWDYIYIEADEEEARSIFYAKFERNPNRVTCTCCGPDYSITTNDSLDQLTAYNRGCAWDDEKKRYDESKKRNNQSRVFSSL